MIFAFIFMIKFNAINFDYDYWAGNFFKILPLCVLIFLLASLIFPNSKKRFFQLQATLPTSKIKSIAKGLVEVEGKLIIKEPLISPVNKEECIGYYYVIEDIYKDSEGKYTYQTSHREQKCNEFEIEDDTGKIKIQPDGIEFLMLEKTNISSNNNTRHTETLIKSGQNMLIIGYCDVINNIPFIKKDTYSKVLGITSVSGITLWNKYKPLLNSFLLLLFAIISVFVLIFLN